MRPDDNQIITNQYFYGGQASDPELGIAASFSYGRALEHRRNPSQLTVLPGPRRIGEGIIQDLIRNIVQVDNGTRYAFGDAGNVYKINTNNVVSFVTKLPTSTDGMLFRNDSDALFFAGKTDVRYYYPVSGTPSFKATYGPSKSIDSKAYRDGGSQSHAIFTSVDEDIRTTFQSDIEPFYSIKVKVHTKGTGFWRLRLHDGLNNLLGISTVAAADVPASGQIEFKFPKQVRALVKPNARSYHFHLTSDVGDSKVITTELNKIETVNFELWADRLVDTVNGLHPMAQFQQFILIGNGRYVAVWEPLSLDDPPNLEFLRHRLVFPDGYEVCGIAVSDEFAVIACEKLSTNATKDFQEGKLFIWDGTTPTYSQVIDVSGGSPEAIQSHENYPYFIVNGTLCAWPGGKNIVKVRTLADTDIAYRNAIDATRVYPNMMTIRDNLLHIAYPSVTSNVNIEHGVHTWGTLDKNYPATWGNLNYAISTQRVLNNDGTLQLGCIRNFGDEMYISWKDGDAYGLDIVDSYCTPAPIAKYRARRFAAGSVYRKKMALRTATNTAALPPGVVVTTAYQIDGKPEVLQTDSTIGEGDDEAIGIIDDKDQRFRRITYGFDIASEGTETPIIYAHSLEWHPLSDEKAF